MLRKSALIIAMMAVVSVGSAAAAAPVAVNGVIRNQTALGVAGRPTPYMRAMAQQTAGQSQIAGGTSFFLLIAGLAAAGFGLYEAFHKGHHHQDTTTPVSS